MHEPELKNLLELSKGIATQAGLRLLNSFGREQKNYVHCVDHPKEIKGLADTVLEKDICDVVIHVKTPDGGYGPVEDIHMIIDHLISNWLIYKAQLESRKSHIPGPLGCSVIYVGDR